MNYCEDALSGFSLEELSANYNNSLDTNYTTPIDDWIQRQFTGYPVIYPITIYHLYPIIIFGRIVHVAWYVIGFIGNCISLKIWTLERMKRLNSSALYLVGITLSDIVYQILHVFFYLKYFWGLPSIGVNGLCQIWNIANVIPQYGSQLLVLGFTIERFVSIFRPFQSERFRKRQRAPTIVAIIALLAIFISTPQAYFWKVDSSGFCEIRNGEDLLNLYTIWSFVSESILFVVVPVVTLLLNVCVLREAHNVLNRHKEIHIDVSGLSRIHNKRGIGYHLATRTLLCISFFRILTQFPVSVTYTMQNLDTFGFGKFMPLEQMSIDPQWRHFILYWGARIIVEVIGASHHALSVFIFYASTKQFRIEISKLFTEVQRTVLGRSVRKSRLVSVPLEMRGMSTASKTTNVDITNSR